MIRTNHHTLIHARDRATNPGQDQRATPTQTRKSQLNTMIKLSYVALTLASREAVPFLVVEGISGSFVSAAETVRAVRDANISAHAGDSYVFSGRADRASPR